MSYVRIAAGLPAFPEPPPVEGEPCARRGVGEPSCRWTTEDDLAERSVHERWEKLRHDPQGLVAVVVYLETRLSKYPRSLVGGSDGEGGRCGDGDGGICGGSGGENVGVATRNSGDACGAMTAEEESRVSSERHCPGHLKVRSVTPFSLVGRCVRYSVCIRRAYINWGTLTDVTVLNDPKKHHRD